MLEHVSYIKSFLLVYICSYSSSLLMPLWQFFDVDQGGLMMINTLPRPVNLPCILELAFFRRCSVLSFLLTKKIYTCHVGTSTKKEPVWGKIKTSLDGRWGKFWPVHPYQLWQVGHQELLGVLAGGYLLFQPLESREFYEKKNQSTWQQASWIETSTDSNLESNFSQDHNAQGLSLCSTYQTLSLWKRKCPH